MPIAPHRHQPPAAADQLPRPERKTTVPSTNFPFLYLNGQPPTTIPMAANNQNRTTPSSQFLNSKQTQNTHSNLKQDTATTNKQVRAPLRKPMMGRMEHCHPIDVIFCILGMLLLLLMQLTPGNSTMGIATCSASRQQPVQKVMTTKTLTPKRKHRSECQLSRSPRSVNVNTILANINLPQTRFETILTVLGPEA
jgi:hypothetical protein